MQFFQGGMTTFHPDLDEAMIFYLLNLKSLFVHVPFYLLFSFIYDGFKKKYHCQIFYLKKFNSNEFKFQFKNFSLLRDAQTLKIFFSQGLGAETRSLVWSILTQCRVDSIL